MAQKHVVFLFTHAPYGSIYYTEGLRAVVGITSGVDEHTIDAVYLGDGVYYTLKGVDRTDSNRYLGTLAKNGYKLKVEQESLAERAIQKGEVADDIEVIPRAEVLSLLAKADHTIDF